MKRIFFILSFFVLASSTMAQSLTIVEPLTPVEHSSVMVQYQNQFGNWNMPEADISFPFAMIRVKLEGSGSEVQAAKQLLQLYLGTQKMITDQYRDTPNEIWFLVEYQIKNIYITCGDGCDKQLLAGGVRLQPNRVYTCKVHFKPEIIDTGVHGNIKWNIQPAAAAKKASFQLMDANGKVKYEGPVDSTALLFFPYIMNATYTYKVSCHLYADVTDTVTVTGQNAEKTVQLQPCYNYLKVKADHNQSIRFTLDNDTTTTYVSGNKVGPLSKGSHMLYCSQQGFVSRVVTVDLNGDLSMIELPVEMSHEKGGLSVSSNPAGASVYVDNRYVGQTPYTNSELATGKHNVEVRHEGYRYESFSAFITKDNTTSIHKDLAKTLSVSFSCNVAGASLALDNDRAVSLPHTQMVEIGNHKITVSRYGYKTYSRTRMLDESNNRIYVNLKRLLNRKNEFYIDFLGSFGQSGFGAGANMGGYIHNVNIEADVLYTWSKSETVYWTDGTNEPISATYTAPLRYTGKLGYGISIGTRFRITPQLGCTYMALQEHGASVADGAYVLSGVIAARMTVAIVNHFGVFVTPDYSMAIHQSDGFKVLSDVSPTIRSWANGFNGRVGFYVFF